MREEMESGGTKSCTCNSSDCGVSLSTAKMTEDNTGYTETLYILYMFNRPLGRFQIPIGGTMS